LRPIIFRWICGFHAALYDEPLGPAESFISPPVPEGRVGETQIDPIPIAEVTPHLVDELKRNRLTGTIDSIICRNGRCHYECVWTQADDGRRICVWALNIYDWRELGDTTHFEPRGCVGVYRLKNGTVPPTAAIATRLISRWRVVIGSTRLRSRHPTNRWTRAAGACFATSLVRRRVL
jgi:hypothetical protein